MLKKVISGGQTGVDKAALEAARKCGLATGGFVPRGWKTEDGTDLSLRAFGVTEMVSPDYLPRTKANVLAADATLIITGRVNLDGGSQVTLDIARRNHKPYALALDLMSPEEPLKRKAEMAKVMEWLAAQRVETLNVAGNRESKNPGIQKKAQAWLEELFKTVAESGACATSRSNLAAQGGLEGSQKKE